jgi:hypothetical protein
MSFMFPLKVGQPMLKKSQFLSSLLPPGQHTGQNRQGYKIAGSLLGKISVAMCQTPSCASTAGTQHVNLQLTVLHSHPGPASHTESSPLQMPHTGLQGPSHLRQMQSVHLMHSGLYLHAKHDPPQPVQACLHLAQCSSHVGLHCFRQGSQSTMQGSNLHLEQPMHSPCT